MTLLILPQKQKSLVKVVTGVKVPCGSSAKKCFCFLTYHKISFINGRKKKGKKSTLPHLVTPIQQSAEEKWDPMVYCSIHMVILCCANTETDRWPGWMLLSMSQGSLYSYCQCLHGQKVQQSE